MRNGTVEAEGVLTSLAMEPHHLPTVSTRNVSAPPAPDCPAVLASVLEPMVGRGYGECVFRCSTLEARDAIPGRWFGAFAFGLVRRGIVVRARLDTQGRTFAVDAVGPGGMLLLGEAPTGITTARGGYAATRALVCLATEDALESTRKRAESVSTDLVRLHAEALERLERLLDARSRPTAEARVGALLCTLADTLTPSRPRETVPASLQQRDLASLLGLRHETVCRVLRSLERRKLVSRADDGIRLVDRAQIEAL